MPYLEPVIPEWGQGRGQDQDCQSGSGSGLDAAGSHREVDVQPEDTGEYQPVSQQKLTASMYGPGKPAHGAEQVERGRGRSHPSPALSQDPRHVDVLYFVHLEDAARPQVEAQRHQCKKNPYPQPGAGPFLSFSWHIGTSSLARPLPQDAMIFQCSGSDAGEPLRVTSHALMSHPFPT